MHKLLTSRTHAQQRDTRTTANFNVLMVECCLTNVPWDCRITQSTTDIISRQLSSRVSIMAQTLFLRGVVRDSIITLATNTMFDIVAYVWGAIGRAFSRHCMVTAHFDSTNEAYEWVMDWFTEQSYAKRTTDVCVGIESQRLESGFGVVAKPKYEPGPGLHVLTYKGRLLLVNRSDVAVNTSGTRQSSITLRIMGTSRSIIEQLVEEARTQAQTKSQGKTAVFLGDQYGSWNRVATRAKRPLSSVLLARGLADGLYQDAREFMHSEEWYRDRGIPYRRGYLLYGPPGNGKSSIVMALAGALDLNIYVVNISAPSLTDELLSDLLCGSAPDRCILLLEDVDHAFNAAADGSTDESTNVKSSSVTFSGLLNAIDGVAAQEGRLLILTTNNPEKLAPALIRPGRIDLRCYLPYATPSMMYRMFENFYSGQEGVQNMAREFVRGVMAAILTLGPNECPKNRCKWDTLSVEPWFGEHVLSPSVGDSEWAANVCQGDCMNQHLPMALIQGFLMKYKTSPRDAIDNCSDFVKDDKHQTAASLTDTHSAVL
ncbi:hypothetical protein SARC_10167 [Sphaeroforma arctica JP610]|uniref:AAA+ ATPase domain-containing protein n=1 Tax=Sphaeroforma arctica JP610 TaxID=667725 RepID=A0A0L0FKQ7_9EUKA|nr:hypothetical protein SARC_10167 [Sphaeroforma arctica JP610]KNC77369.1 hypothetical protein SARC_10167 [Sphaeroforma arctica JP610]|eukprot:XP_014151271.1 hypothetical protein SARC_10167 [Sphaeroforma arctica JP610]